MENQKKMSLFDLVFMSIGGIIGAGIFSWWAPVLPPPAEALPWH